MPTTDHHDLLLRNLLEVFGQRDPEQRRTAIDELHAPDVVFYEPDQVVRGREALSARVQELLDGAPAFQFRPAGEVATVQDLERLSWNLGPEGGDPVVTGTDIALVADGKITALYTIIDSSAPPSTAH